MNDNRNIEQRGAVIPITALAIFALMMATALAVDIGRSTGTNRDLQSVADLAALDSARVIDGRAAIAQQATVEEAATKSATRNEFGADAADNLVVELGTVVDGNFVVSAPGEVPSVVRVEAAHDLDYLFVRGERTLDRHALAAADTAQAGLTVGSFALAVDTGDIAAINALLGSQLGGPVNASLIGYRGLADTNVTLLELATAAGFGSADQMLDANLTAGQLLTIFADALSARGDASSLAAIGALNQLHAATTVTSAVRLADLMGIDVGQGTALANIEFGLGNLVQATASAVNTHNLLNLALAPTIPGVVSGSLKVTVIEGAQSAYGPPRSGSTPGATVTTSQIRVYADLQLVNLLGGVVHLPIAIDVSPATAELVGITCDAGNPVGVQTEVSPSLARIRLGQLTDAQISSLAAPTSPATLLNVLGLVTVRGDADVNVFASDATINAVPGYGPDNTISVGVNGLVGQFASADINLHVQALSLVPVIGVQGQILNILGPVISSVLPVVDTLGLTSGVTAGGADVTTWAAECSGPRLLQ